MESDYIDVMRFIRRDGPAEARFVFLSIEDGGGFDSKERFKQYFSRDPVWAPTTREQCELGKPGEIISKMMCSVPA